jgi:hypothetical protein
MVGGLAGVLSIRWSGAAAAARGADNTNVELAPVFYKETLTGRGVSSAAKPRSASRGESTDMFRIRQSTIDAHLPFLDAQWASAVGMEQNSGAACRLRGFQGSLRVVSEDTAATSGKATDQQVQKVPSARTIMRLMTWRAIISARQIP